MLSLYKQCFRGMSGIVYPDGGSVLDQPLLLLEAFNVIAAAREVAREDKSGADGPA